MLLGRDILLYHNNIRLCCMKTCEMWPFVLMATENSSEVQLESSQSSKTWVWTTCVEDMDYLLFNDNKEQVVKVGIGESTNRQYVYRATNKKKPKTIINLRASHQDSISSSPL